MIIQKDPASVLDFVFDWSGWLVEFDTIIAHTVTPTGVTAESSTATTDKVTVWLSGGSAGETAHVTCRITTAHGRVDERTMPLTIRDR